MIGFSNGALCAAAIAVVVITIAFMMSMRGSALSESKSGFVAGKLFAGAAPSLTSLKNKSHRCSGGYTPVLSGGYIEAYRSITSTEPCARIEANGISLTNAALRDVEAALARSCGQRPGWFVADAVWQCGGARETFSWGTNPWGQWTENTDKENFNPVDSYETPNSIITRPGPKHVRLGGSAGDMGDDYSRDIREGFSPDQPGACAKKFDRAAQAEIEVLSVLAGN